MDFYEDVAEPHQTITITESEINSFKEIVLDWLELDDRIKQLDTQSRKLKKERKDLTPKILDFMKEKNINDCNTSSNSGESIQYKVTYVKKPLNKQTLQTQLATYFRNIDKGQEVANYIMENREKQERVNLKRVIPKNRITLG